MNAAVLVRPEKEGAPTGGGAVHKVTSVGAL